LADDVIGGEPDVYTAEDPAINIMPQSLTNISGTGGAPFFITRLGTDDGSVLGIFARRLVIEAEGKAVWDAQITFSDFAWLVQGLASTLLGDIRIAERFPAFRHVGSASFQARLAEDLRQAARSLEYAADAVEKFEFQAMPDTKQEEPGKEA
jgi:hypothetical protein